MYLFSPQRMKIGAYMRRSERSAGMFRYSLSENYFVGRARVLPVSSQLVCAIEYQHWTTVDDDYRCRPAGWATHNLDHEWVLTSSQAFLAAAGQVLFRYHEKYVLSLQ